MNMDRAVKSAIWKEDMKRLITSNIMQVGNDDDAMDLMLEQNPEFFIKAFKLMATNDKAFKKIQAVEGFNFQYWLNNMQVKMVTTHVEQNTKRKKPASTSNRTMNPEGGMASRNDENNGQIASHESSSEDIPIASSHKFTKPNAKVGACDLSARGKKPKGRK